MDGMAHLSDLLLDPSHLVVHFFQFGPDIRNVVAFQGLKLGEENTSLSANGKTFWPPI